MIVITDICNVDAVYVVACDVDDVKEASVSTVIIVNIILYDVIGDTTVVTVVGTYHIGLINTFNIIVMYTYICT